MIEFKVNEGIQHTDTAINRIEDKLDKFKTEVNGNLDTVSKLFDAVEVLKIKVDQQH